MPQNLVDIGMEATISGAIGGARHLQQLKFLANFLGLKDLRYVDKGLSEELYLTRADGETLELHASGNGDQGAFFVVPEALEPA